VVFSRTDTASVQRPHVEDVDALHLAENFQTLQTGSLLKVGRDGTGGTTRREKVVLILDLRQRSQELVLLAGLRVAFSWVTVESPHTPGEASPCDGGRAEGRSGGALGQRWGGSAEEHDFGIVTRRGGRGRGRRICAVKLSMRCP